MNIHVAIEDYLACKKNRLTHDTYHWYQWMLGQFEKWCKMQDLTDLAHITPALVQQFVAAEPASSDNTKHHRAQVVKGFLRWCSLDEDTGVKKKTVSRIEMPKVEETEIKLYTEAEIKRLLIACEKTRDPLRNRAIVLLLLDTGVRVAELCYDSDRPEEKTGLLLENMVVGTQGNESYIIVMGKGRKTRTVKMGKATCQAVVEYIRCERPHTAFSYLFIARRKEGPLTARGLENLCVRLGELAKVNKAHPHRFRHTFAINQLLAGTSAFVLMQLMGHSTLESTKTYIRALSQMQARQASASIVDVLWEKVQPDQPACIHQSIDTGRQQKRAKAKPVQKIAHQEDGKNVVLKRNRDPKPLYAQWSRFFQTWQERCSTARLTTSRVRDLLFDVLPESVHSREGEHPKAFLYRLRTALQERCGVSYGDIPIMLRCWPAVKRGMNQWQVYQVPPAR